MNAPFTYASPTLSIEALKHSIAYKLMFTIGKDPVIANKHEWLNATLFAVRDRLVERWLRSNRAQLSQEMRQVYYLSMEFLIGRTLSNALLSLGIYEDVNSALEEMGLNLEELIDEENDPGLGNGGLGRRPSPCPGADHRRSGRPVGSFAHRRLRRKGTGGRRRTAFFLFSHRGPHHPDARVGCRGDPSAGLRRHHRRRG